MKKAVLSSLLFLLFSLLAQAVCNVIPLPQKYEEHKTQKCPVAKLKTKPAVKMLKKIDGVPEHAQAEAYLLTITAAGAKISATSKLGIANAQKTLDQMLWAAELDKSQTVPACKIKDWPAYPYRSFMIDCGRSYIPIKDLKGIIDFLAARKINVFHWHLTDNQGWRLESKIYPKLNAPASYERDPGKFYKFSELREFVDYCYARGVTVVPEIDVPGHNRAFVKAMGFDPQSEQGLVAVKRLLTEAFENAFPQLDKTPFFHIGTDEVRIDDTNFVPAVRKHVRDAGRKVGIWNPGAQVAPGEVDLVNMWSSRGCPLTGTLSVDGRLHYLNHFDGFADPVAVLFSNFGGVPECNGTIGGGEAAIWADRYIVGTEGLLQNNAFHASMLAFAESVWRGGRKDLFKTQGVNIPFDGEELEYFKDFERRELYVKREMGKAFPWVPQADIIWRITDEPFDNGGDFKKAFPPEKEKSLAGFKTRLARGAAIYLRHVWGEDTVAGFFKNPQKNSTVYAEAFIKSDKAQKIGAYIQTHYYSASEPDLPPPAGKWDYFDSKVWINGKELPPPDWKNSHKNKSQEIPLQNENWTTRPPMQIQLKPGINRILFKLPAGTFSLPQLRLSRWMFTFAPVSLDGNAPVKSIEFVNPESVK
ncbi:MAG: beta-N-acetylhexosaminidase [Opitutales bacterium]|nr:beta-N-acetylhexosaminidase [Opitutales bacterium]